MPGVDLLCLPGVVTVRPVIFDAEREMKLEAKLVKEQKRCDVCGKESTLIKYGTRKRTYWDSPIRDYKTFISLTVQRFKCASCKAIFPQKASKANPGLFGANGLLSLQPA